MLISTRPPAGGSTSVTGTVRRRCRPRSGRCGSRSRGIGRVRSRRGSSRSTAAGWMGSRRRSASLYAKGPTTGEISAQLADVYDADVSRELISRVTDSVVDEMRLRTAACPTPDHLIRSLGRTVRLGLDTPTTAGLGAACCCVGPSSAAPGAGCCHGGLLGREPEAGKLRSLRNAVQDQGRVHAGGSNLRVDEPSAEVVNGLHDDLVPYLAPVEPKGIPLADVRRLWASCDHDANTRNHEGVNGQHPSHRYTLHKTGSCLAEFKTVVGRRRLLRLSSSTCRLPPLAVRVCPPVWLYQSSVLIPCVRSRCAS